MKRWLPSAVALTLLLPGLQSTLRSADASEEQQLIGVLQSNRSPQDKDAACARLKRVGTAQSVWALAALLADERLSHSARYALESMSAPEAEQALIDSLDRTKGLTKVGIIGSLGVRGDARAVPMLAKALAGSDTQMACAAASALGKIAGPEALEALENSLHISADPPHGAVVDAVLRSAHRLLASGDRSRAFAVFRRLYDSEKEDRLRQAAFRGMISASGDRAVALVTAAIAGRDGASQAAALQLVREIEDPAATKSLVELLPKVSPVVQTALIEGLAQRGDTSAAPAVAVLAGSDDPVVQLSAVKALGILGDASVAVLLAQTAASSDSDIQEASRRSLLQLHRGQVTDALLAPLASAQPAVQVELARAIGARVDTSALPRLLDLARSGPGTAQTAAYQALALLAGSPEVAPMVRLVIEGKSALARTEASKALGSVCQRLQSRHADLDAGAIAEGLRTGDTEARMALLPVCSALIHPLIRDTLRRASADPDLRVRATAIRAVCETRDADLLPDLLRIARTEGEASLRVLAIRGGVRLTTQEESVRCSIQQRLDALTALLDCATRVEERRLILSGLAEVPDPEALRLVVPLLDRSDVQNEAAQAATKIAGAIAGSQGDLASAAMKKVLAVSTDAGARQAADTVLKQIEATAGFVTAWQVAGPYRQDGKDYAALFDIAFAPERPEAQDVPWRPLPPGTDPARPWLMDLLKALGGEQCVAYARTRVYSEIEQAAVLELGSDDGVKVWLNGTLAYANNAARPLTPGSDKVNLTLGRGWNTLLLKVTQNNLSWEFCARIVQPDGSPLGGLRLDASADRGHPSRSAVELRARAGLANSFAKVRAGGKVTVAYLGGSITEAETLSRNQNKIDDPSRYAPWIRLWNEYQDRGGRLKIWIGQPDPEPGLMKEHITAAARNGAKAICIQGVQVDAQMSAGRLDVLRDWLELIKGFGLPAGMATHGAGTHLVAEEKGLPTDFYYQTLYRPDNYVREGLEESLTTIEKLDKPVVAYKVLGAGRFLPKDTLPYVFKRLKPKDGICIGVFPKRRDELAENARLARRLSHSGAA